MRLKLFIISMCLYLAVNAQRLIEGHVYDAESGSAIERVSIFNRSSHLGTFSDKDGTFRIRCEDNDTILVTAIGYEPTNVVLTPDSSSLHLYLEQKATVLNEVVVSRKKYSKKNNPAVELVKRIIKKRDDGRLENLDYYQRIKHQRIAYGLNDFDSKEDNHILNQFPFLRNYADTISVNGIVKPVLPVSVDESVIEQQWNASSSNHVERSLSSSHAGIDDAFDLGGIKTYIENIIGSIDIFQNDIRCMNYHFVSPLSNIGVSFYKYYLGDTVLIDDEKCVQLIFVPHNSQDMGFMGSLYVTCDSTHFVKNVEMSLPRNVNLNFVGNINVKQKFNRVNGVLRALEYDYVSIEFVIFKNAQTLFAQINTQMSDYGFNPTDTIVTNHFNHPFDFGLRSTQDMDKMIENLRQSKKYFWSEFAIKSLVQDFIPTAPLSSSSYFDFGPISNIFSSNGLEGFKIRLGGQTTTHFSNHMQLGGYAAWGFKDKKIKYGIYTTYSFTLKEAFFNEAQINAISFTHQYDSYLLGNNLMFNQTEAFLIPISRKPDDKCIYQRLTQLKYQREWDSKFLMTLAVQNNCFLPSRLVTFTDGLGQLYDAHNSSGFTVSLRLALNEKFIVNRKRRVQLNEDALIMMVSHTCNPDGFMGNKQVSNITQIGLQKRIWLSGWGFADFIVKAEKQWNQVHFINLILPNVNLTNNIQSETFALMDVMEFANDQQLSWFLKCRLNGLLLNRIPLIKRLKMRELFTFSGLWGSLSRNNDPTFNDNLLRFPEGTALTKMGNKPYMEIGVGVENILRILSIQYVWRLNYRNNPNIDKSGLRFQLNFKF